jgi:hypothetical protein
MTTCTAAEYCSQFGVESHFGAMTKWIMQKHAPTNASSGSNIVSACLFPLTHSIKEAKMRPHDTKVNVFDLRVASIGATPFATRMECQIPLTLVSTPTGIATNEMSLA